MISFIADYLVNEYVGHVMNLFIFLFINFNFVMHIIGMSFIWIRIVNQYARVNTFVCLRARVRASVCDSGDFIIMLRYSCPWNTSIFLSTTS